MDVLLKPPGVRIIVQARTTSSRLPGKALLPLAGECLAVLCAKRLGQTGREVMLATSDDASDDLLAARARADAVAVFRGPLHDVRQRFLDCAADLPDEAIIVRATADNPVPDGRFVEALLSHFVASGAIYLGTSSPTDGLPYGLSAEVFRLGALRAVAGDGDAFDREHVTPALRRAAGAAGVLPAGFFYTEDRSALRVTVDTPEDYLASCALFADLDGDVGTPWQVLIDHLWSDTQNYVVMPQQHCARQYVSALMLGTAQLGMSYGATNRSGQPNAAEAAAILCEAVDAGISHLDTARAYGNAERRIGTLLPPGRAARVQIVTKLSTLEALADDAAEADVVAEIDQQIALSCAELGRAQLDVLMFHRSADMFRWGGLALVHLAQYVEQGRIHALGASVYTPQEACACLEDPRIVHLQIPFNVLDTRWCALDFSAAIARRPEVCVHVRSVFLQGLLLHGAAAWPVWCEQSAALVARLDGLVDSLDRRDRSDLCIAYVRGHPWVTSLVVGVETVGQLRELVERAAAPVLTSAQCESVAAQFGGVSARLLNPSLW